MKAIVAFDEKRGMGFQNRLPWKIPIKDDFSWFKEFTMGKILVVGWNTASTLPPLKNRNKIIINKSNIADPYLFEDYYDPIINSAQTYMSSSCVVELDALQPNLVCIGGAKTYELFLPIITEFYVTHVKGSYDADVFMCGFEDFFPNKELIKELDGGHKIIKYYK